MADFEKIYSPREVYLKLGELGLGARQIRNIMYYKMPREQMCRRNFEHYEYDAPKVDKFVKEYAKGIPDGWFDYPTIMEKFSISRPTLEKLIHENDIPVNKFFREKFYMQESLVEKAIKKESGKKSKKESGKKSKKEKAK